MAKKAYIGVDGKARKIKTGYIGVGNFVPRALPSGYTQVEYIQSSGTQYINTGYAPSGEDMQVVFDFAYTASHSTSSLFGTESNANYTIVPYNQPAFYVAKSTAILTQTTALNTRYVLDAHANNGTFTLVFNGIESVAAYSGSLSKDLSVFLLASNKNGSATQFTSAKLYSCQIYDNGTLVRDYIPCISPSGTAGLYDIVNAKFYSNAGTGTFSAGATYTSLAHKIKKAYIGIGGVARPCWSGGELAYYGAITSLSTARYQMSATSLESYAFFFGGTGSGVTQILNAYDKSLTQAYTHSSAFPKSYNGAATSTGDYAIFAGGQSSNTGYSNNAHAINSSLSITNANGLNTTTTMLAATTVGDYALFGGGKNASYRSEVKAFTSSLTASVPTALSYARFDFTATTIGDYALFGGGYNSSGSSAVVDCYDTSLTKSVATSLSYKRCGISATTVGNYAIFSGDSTNTACDVYDASLTRTTPIDFSVMRNCKAATTVGDYALFGGGENMSTYNTVDAFDASLTRTIPTPLSESKCAVSATTIGDYALFAGGQEGTNWTAVKTVDAYTVA